MSAKITWGGNVGLLFDSAGNCRGEFRVACARTFSGPLYTGYLYQGSKKAGTYKRAAVSKHSTKNAMPQYQWAQEQAEKLVGEPVAQVRLENGTERPFMVGVVA